MKPLSGNDCNTCPKKFDCYTNKEYTVCPILSGCDIEDVFPMQRCNIAVRAFGRGLWKDGYRIKPEELKKVLSKAKFRVNRKYGCNYLEVIQ